ncbi:restriction endonuclease subunit S [Haemophilus influenzae]|uniref:EcoKI restriction-modification system protein HsdS n=1 Tax=Haemophilus influenzae TaxID=727 RepID=A0A2S9S064_HAEIF|nr:restriction endonuclease subunit S [Haemophilus influenzae]EEW78375.1 type I restriction/modification specificity protein [Haemophilus influenzae NT127]MCK8794724.1 restriction endonuclease subunit S [Haemophilus influenzae]MCK8830308.1 restriction endonuclease subunit S [Haemophilus influenzae]MCK8840869.1 restriction endonuclease subunit S [Haemophilus influenzae]MCK8925497.1 restriction endonuclease subunit S [Haemophilus influenzae]
MSNWKVMKLSEVATIVGGGTPSSSKSEYFENGNIPWITPKDLSGYNKRYISKGERNITELGLKNSSAKLLPKNTVLLTSRAPIGYVAIASNEISTNQGFKSLVLNNGHIPEFFYYLLKNNVHILESRATGSTFKEISGQILKDTELSIPTPDIQQKIVDILSPLDDKIELNTQINQTLEQIAQALFKSWFVDFDPVRAKVQALSDGLSLEQAELAAMQAISGKTPEELTALSQTQPDRYAELAETAKVFPCEMVEIDGVEAPRGWEMKALSDLGQIICGKTPSKSNKEFYGDAVPFIKIPDMHNQVFITQTTDNLSVVGANYQSKKYIPAKSICVSCIATVGLVSMTSKPSHTNQQINSIIPDDEQSCEFLYLSLKQPSMTKYLKDLASGGTATFNLNTSTFSKIEIITPSKEIIYIFQKKVVSIFEKTLSNSIENKRLTEIRDLLLPRLLSGEI